MPIHDWTKVIPDTFSDLHHSWITTIKASLNREQLASTHYSLAELETDLLPRKRSRVAISTTRDDRVVALIDIVSPANKSSRQAVDAFVNRVVEALKAGIHFLVIDLFPPGPHDPQGIHGVIWTRIKGVDFEPVVEKPLMVVSYCCGLETKPYLETTAVGNALPEMPLFLDARTYVLVQLAKAYQNAFEGVPQKWRKRLES